MNRDLKIYYLVIGLPALLLALGGLRLLGLEAQRSRALARSALKAKAEMVAHELRASIRERVTDRKELAVRLPEILKAIELNREDDEPEVTAELCDMRAERPPKPKAKKGGREKGKVVPREKAAPHPKPPHVRLPWYVCQVGLGPEAPGWQLRLRWSEGVRIAEQASQRVWLIGASVLSLLVMTLLAGGWLLVRAARKARLAARMETDFTANVSHELKTPLTEIRLAAEFAESRTDDADVKTALADVISAAERLTKMVSDVLDCGRLADGRKLELEPVDVGGGTLALANREALRHILDNLRDNAEKYAPGAPCETQVRTCGDRVEVAVLDRGPGVAPELREKIFERYRRGEDVARSGVSGCGLGLAIARMLARAMRGDLVCRAREGGGSAFVLSLGKA